MSLPYPDKSQTPVLDSTVTMAADLWGLWWFGEASGVTIKDWSHFGNHMTVTGISDASWVDHGTNQWALKINQKGYSHARRDRANGRPAISVGDPYAAVFLLRIDEIGERGSIAGFDDWGRFQFWQTGAQTRIFGRGEAAGDRRFDYYNGFVWELNISSSASGQLDMWVITAEAGSSGVRFYKNGELIHGPSRNNWFQTGTAGWLLEGGSDTLGCQGELVMFAEFGRNLSLEDVQTLTSEPFQILGYTPGAPGGGGGSEVTNTHSVGAEQNQVWAGGSPGGNVISQGMMDARSEMGFGRPQAHILDWLGGAD